MKKIFRILALPLALSACQYLVPRNDSMSESEGVRDRDSSGLPFVFSSFKDIAIPEGASMNVEDTQIFGRDENWVGRVSYTSPYGLSGIYDFYLSEMPKFGWTELTTLRGGNPTLVYIRGKRVALLQVSSASNRGTKVHITMSTIPSGINVTTTQAQAPAPRKIAAAAYNVDAEMVGVATYDMPAPIAPVITPAPMVRAVVAPVHAPAPAPVAVGERDPLGLGDASNRYYPSRSPGVGAPPTRR